MSRGLNAVVVDVAESFRNRMAATVLMVLLFDVRKCEVEYDMRLCMVYARYQYLSYPTFQKTM